MRSKKHRIIRGMTVIILAAGMILSSLPVSALEYAYSEPAGPNAETIHSTYYSITADEYHTMEVRYDPDWFKETARVYNHELAKLSMGLAEAAFRPSEAHLEGITSTDMNLNNFLTEAHFKDLRSDDYDKDPNIYSISTVMGHQKIGEGDDAFELIAVGVCGQFYENEWESNFSIGTGKFHEGFLRSSELVYDRIFGYIASLHLEGPYKIWISGFSRAAAVSSLTASMLTDSKYFDMDTVYAYTFATPRYVKDPDYNRYENIFNIVGKTDPVPAIPFAEWGYERYGQSFYLPTFETDSDFEERRARANEVYKELTGLDFWYNSEASYFLRTVLGYLIEICPTPEKYHSCLEQRIISIMDDKTPLNVMANLLAIANDPELINDDTRYEARQFLNSLVALLRDYREGTAIFREWNEKASTLINLAQAHTPEVYASWLFSTDNIAEIYNPFDTYSEVSVSGDVEVSIVKDGVVLETLPSIVKYSQRADEYSIVPKRQRQSTDGYDFLNYSDYLTVVLVPRDEEYSIVFKTNGGSIVSMAQLDYTISRQKAAKATFYDYTMPPGTDLVMNLSGLKREFEPDDEVDLSVDPELKTTFSSSAGIKSSELVVSESYVDFDVTDTILVTRMRDSSLDWGTAAMIVISGGLFVIAMVFFQITYLFGRVRFKRRKKRGMLPQDAKYRGLPTIIVYSIVFLFFVMEFYSRLLPDNKHVVIIFKIIIGATSVLIALYGYRKNKNVLSGRIMAGLILLMIADVGMTLNVNIGPVFHILAYGFLSYAFIRDERPDQIQYIIWAVLSSGAAGLISNIQGNFGVLKLFGIIYAAAALFMAITSVDQSRSIMIGSMLLALAGFLTMRNIVIGNTFASHILSLGTYYVGIAVLASSTIQRQMYRYIPVPIQQIGQ